MARRALHTDGQRGLFDDEEVVGATEPCAVFRVQGEGPESQTQDAHPNLRPSRRPHGSAGPNGGAVGLHIDVAMIAPNPFQLRAALDETALDELAMSVQKHGILQPLVVRRVGQRYQVVAGERRRQAALRAGLRQVPCIVRPLSDDQMEIIAVVENIQRQQLDAVEEGCAYQRLQERYHLSVRAIAARVHRSHGHVQQCLHVAADTEVRQAVQRHVVGKTVATHLSRLHDLDRRREFLDRAAQGERITVAEVLQALANERACMHAVHDERDAPVHPPAQEVPPVSNNYTPPDSAGGDRDVIAFNGLRIMQLAATAGPCAPRSAVRVALQADLEALGQQ